MDLAREVRGNDLKPSDSSKLTRSASDGTDSVKFPHPDWDSGPRLVDVGEQAHHAVLPPFDTRVRQRLFR